MSLAVIHENSINISLMDNQYHVFHRVLKNYYFLIIQSEKETVVKLFLGHRYANLQIIAL